MKQHFININSDAFTWTSIITPNKSYSVLKLIGKTGENKENIIELIKSLNVLKN